MELQAYLGIAIQVISDWRVIFITVTVLLLWAALRYIGSVYHRRPRRPPVLKNSAPPMAAKTAKAPARSAAEGEGPGGGDMIE